jgi:hypothetical protein
MPAEVLPQSWVFVSEAHALAQRRRDELPILTLRHARQLIENEVFDLHLLLINPFDAEAIQAPWEKARLHLLRIAATAMQAANQLGIESRQDAIAKEIPF